LYDDRGLARRLDRDALGARHEKPLPTSGVRHSAPRASPASPVQRGRRGRNAGDLGAELDDVRSLLAIAGVAAESPARFFFFAYAGVDRSTSSTARGLDVHGGRPEAPLREALRPRFEHGPTRGGPGGLTRRESASPAGTPTWPGPSKVSAGGAEDPEDPRSGERQGVGHGGAGSLYIEFDARGSVARASCIADPPWCDALSLSCSARRSPLTADFAGRWFTSTAELKNLCLDVNFAAAPASAYLFLWLLLLPIFAGYRGDAAAIPLSPFAREGHLRVQRSAREEASTVAAAAVATEGCTGARRSPSSILSAPLPAGWKGTGASCTAWLSWQCH
jgi:hypothetical protein